MTGALTEDKDEARSTHLTCPSSCAALSFPPCFSVLIFSPAILSLFSYSLTLASHFASACAALVCSSAILDSSSESWLVAFPARFSAAAARSVRPRTWVEDSVDELALAPESCWESSAMRAWQVSVRDHMTERRMERVLGLASSLCTGDPAQGLNPRPATTRRRPPQLTLAASSSPSLIAYLLLHCVRVISSFLTAASKLSSARHFCSSCFLRALQLSALGFTSS